MEAGVDLGGHFGCATEFHPVVVVALGGVFDLDFVGCEVDNVFVVADAENEVLEFTGEQDGAVCFCQFTCCWWILLLNIRLFLDQD